VSGFCEFGNEPSGSVKYGESEDLFCSQEGLGSMELIT
jgi:hypothetical protein